MIKVFNSVADYNTYISEQTLPSGEIAYVKDETGDKVHFSTNNITGEFKTYDFTQNPYYSELSKISSLLHTIRYDKIDYDYAYDFFKESAPEVNIGGCSAIKSGDYFCRNLDWYEADKNYEDAQPDFIVWTPSTDKIKSVLGVASCPHLTEKIAENHYQSELFRILPFYLQDGINEAGLYSCINVVPRDKGENTFSIPDVSKEDEVCALMIVRYVLDKFSDATTAVEYLRDYVSIYFPSTLTDMDYETHWIIGDASKCYVLEIEENKVVITENNIMTNFFIDGVSFLEDGTVLTNVDEELPSSIGITSHGSGLERYNLLVSGDKSDMRELMNTVLYSKAYDLTESPYWYSEFTGGDITVDTPADDENLQEIIQKAQEIKEGTREGRLWITTHSCVYDLTEKSLNIVSFENTSREDNFYLFNS